MIFCGLKDGLQTPPSVITSWLWRPCTERAAGCITGANANANANAWAVAPAWRCVNWGLQESVRVTLIKAINRVVYAKRHRLREPASADRRDTRR